MRFPRDRLQGWSCQTRGKHLVWERKWLWRQGQQKLLTPRPGPQASCGMAPCPIPSSLPGKQSSWRKGQGCTGPCSKAEQDRAGGQAAREDGGQGQPTFRQMESRRQKTFPKASPHQPLKDKMSLRHQLLHFHFQGSVLTAAELPPGAATPSVSTGCPGTETGQPAPALRGLQEPQLARSAEPPNRHVTMRASS